MVSWSKKRNQSKRQHGNELTSSGFENDNQSRKDSNSLKKCHVYLIRQYFRNFIYSHPVMRIINNSVNGIQQEWKNRYIKALEGTSKPETLLHFSFFSFFHVEDSSS